jgi:hypothetical protein
MNTSRVEHLIQQIFRYSAALKKENLVADYHLGLVTFFLPKEQTFGAKRGFPHKWVFLSWAFLPRIFLAYKGL